MLTQDLHSSYSYVTGILMVTHTTVIEIHLHENLNSHGCHVVNGGFTWGYSTTTNCLKQ